MLETLELQIVSDNEDTYTIKKSVADMQEIIDSELAKQFNKVLGTIQENNDEEIKLSQKFDLLLTLKLSERVINEHNENPF